MATPNTPAWKLLGSTYGNRAGELLAEMATHAQGLQAALDELAQLLDLPPNHALSSRQVVMLIKDEAVQEALTAIGGPKSPPLPDSVATQYGGVVLEWVRARCTVLAGGLGGSTNDELYAHFLDDDGLLGPLQFSKGLKEIGVPVRKSETWGVNGRGTVRRTWNLAVTAKAPYSPAPVVDKPPTPEPPPTPDWVDGGPWPGKV